MASVHLDSGSVMEVAELEPSGATLHGAVEAMAALCQLDRYELDRYELDGYELDRYD